MQTKSQLQVWPKSCEHCAIKRGWIVEDLLKETGGTPSWKCEHRIDLFGNTHVCAALKKRFEDWSPNSKPLVITASYPTENWTMLLTNKYHRGAT